MGEIKTATARLQSGMHFNIETNRGYQLDVDGAPNHGGQGKGASPMALLLAGLVGCTAMDVASILRKQRQRIDSMTVSAEGERAETHPKVYTRIKLHYTLSGEVTEKALATAIELSTTKYCSVSAMLKQSAELITSFEIQ
jgi:putative redox protein